MELLLINNEKLKVVLSEEDMDKYSISCDSMNYSNTETRKAFWCILDEAKHKTGFDAAEKKVLIQVYPMKCGGCEIYVTKVANDKAPEMSLIQKAPEKPVLFLFASLDDLIKACRTLGASGCCFASDLYKSEDGQYYLKLKNTENADAPISSCDVLYEFGEKIDDDLIPIIYDRSTCLCQNSAVKTLSAL